MSKLTKKDPKFSNSIIKTRIKNTDFWILGEQQRNKYWDIYLINSKNNKKELLKENITTKIFSIFSELILKQPFIK